MLLRTPGHAMLSCAVQALPGVWWHMGRKDLDLRLVRTQRYVCLGKTEASGWHMQTTICWLVRGKGEQLLQHLTALFAGPG